MSALTVFLIVVAALCLLVLAVVVWLAFWGDTGRVFSDAGRYTVFAGGRKSGGDVRIPQQRLETDADGVACVRLTSAGLWYVKLVHMEPVQNSGGAGALLGVGLVGAIWSASGYIGAFVKASNAIYNVKEGRGFTRLRPIQLGLTVLFLGIVAFGSIVFVASGPILESIGDVVGLGGTAVTVWSIVKWPVLAVAVIALIALLYWAAPNVEQPRVRWITPGGKRRSPLLCRPPPSANALVPRRLIGAHVGPRCFVDNAMTYKA